MIFFRRAVPALFASLLILALPASASAANFVVNSTADEADAIPGGFCDSAAGKCTLRAAIEVTNLTLAEKDRIEFSGTVFKGDLASTINPATALPAITVPLEIDGGDCFGEDGPDAPCAGIKGPSGAAALTVENANAVAIKGLSITGAQFGIDVLGSSEGFIARNDWIGLNLNAAKEGNLTGIFLDPGSDGATIGGPAASERNVISGNEGVGLDLSGASEATIEGNYFGVSIPGPVGIPGGSQQIANGENIEITDSTAGGGIKAEDNEVGATIEGAELTTPGCDGGCNVIAGSLSTGLDLNGEGLEEKPATGPTTVHGNFVGLDATGTGVVANATIGIWVGGADHVRVGAPLFVAPGPDRNYIAGGLQGIASETGGNGFEARANSIGFGSDGSEQTPPTGVGIFVLGSGVTEESEIESNAIRSTGTAGIEVRDLTGRIIGNEIQGGSRGIVAGFGSGGGLIAGNEVDAPEEFGILVESPNNDVRGNTITNSNGAGIAVKPPTGVTPTIGNVIGGSSTGTENVINGSTGPAIEIVEEAGEPGSWTEITRNRGAFNGGLFIDLVTGANQGILPPVISAATQTKAEGTSKPNAVIRLFRKATASPGEVEAFLAETEADGSGKWSVAYGSIPAGTNLAATQTEEEVGTSELALATAAADPSNGGGGGNGGGGNGGGNNGGGNAKDKTPPDTKILKGPPKKTHKRTVKFKFASTEAGSTFQCKLDRKPFKPCASPKKYKQLKPGKHVFKVRAIDKAGNVDPTPAKRSFKVLK